MSKIAEVTKHTYLSLLDNSDNDKNYNNTKLIRVGVNIMREAGTETDRHQLKT